MREQVEREPAHAEGPEELDAVGSEAVEEYVDGSSNDAEEQDGSEAQGRMRRGCRWRAAREKIKCERDGESDDGCAEDGMQQSEMVMKIRARAAEVAEQVEVGDRSGDNENGERVAANAAESSAVKRCGNERVSYGVH